MSCKESEIPSAAKRLSPVCLCLKCQTLTSVTLHKCQNLTHSALHKCQNLTQSWRTSQVSETDKCHTTHASKSDTWRTTHASVSDIWHTTQVSESDAWRTTQESETDTCVTLHKCQILTLVSHWHMAHSMLTCGGASMKWNCSKSWTPRDFRRSTTLARLVLCISGTVLSSNSFLYARSVYRR